MTDVFIVRKSYKSNETALAYFSTLDDAFACAMSYGESIVSRDGAFPGSGHHISVHQYSLQSAFNSLDALPAETFITETTLEVGEWRTYFDINMKH